MKDLYPGLRVSQAEQEDIFETRMTNYEWMRYRITGGALPDRYLPVQERRFREQTRDRYKKFEPHVVRSTPIDEIPDFETYMARSTDTLTDLTGELQVTDRKIDIQGARFQIRAINIGSIQHHEKVGSDPRTIHIREQAQTVADLTVARLQDPQLSSRDRAELIKILNHARLVSQTEMGAMQIGKEQARLFQVADTEALALIWKDRTEEELGRGMFRLMQGTRGFLNRLDEDEGVNHHLILADGLSSYMNNSFMKGEREETLTEERQWMDILLDESKRRTKGDVKKYQEVADRYVSILCHSAGNLTHRSCVMLLNTLMDIYRPENSITLAAPSILPFLRTMYMKKASALALSGHEKVIFTQIKELCEMFQIDLEQVISEKED